MSNIERRIMNFEGAAMPSFIIRYSTFDIGLLAKDSNRYVDSL